MLAKKEVEEPDYNVQAHYLYRSGSSTGIFGNVEACTITIAERNKNINIADLVMPESDS